MDQRAIKRRLLHATLWLLLGLLVTIAVAMAFALRVEGPHRSSTIEALDGDDTRRAIFEWGIGSQSLEFAMERGLAWAPMRATGAPDTKMVGDIPTAWASKTQDAQVEWLELDYQRPVVATLLRVYETLAPGALVKVEAFDAAGQSIETWAGSDPAKQDPSGVYVAEIPLQSGKPVSRVRLTLDSPAVPGWNEIDAVGLVDSQGNVQWASDARASSTYAVSGSASGSINFAQLDAQIPWWAPALDWGAPSQIEARGWPLVALRTAPFEPALLATGMSYAISPVGSLRPAPLPARTSAGGVSALRLPTRPIWTGILIDSAFFGAVLFVLYAATFGLRRFVRQSLWLRKGKCMRCGYDLQFDLLRGCPECGWRRAVE